MGDKLAARRTAEDAGVPIVPGVTVASDDADAVAALGDELGWPIAVKAVHGGGGRGMRVIERRGDVPDAIDSARRESQAAFGRPDVYVERYLARPRHVEVQVVADHHGGLVVVGDRDCSIQRRYQKLVEEAPAPSLPESVRAALARASIQLVRAVGYTNAGTIEFLVEDDRVYFLEMNTRIQVEHPVTELVTGVDLVVEQLRIARGEPLSFGASDVEPRGHAIEVRINAEDTTDARFIPTPGVLARFDLPSGPRVRVDTGFRTGDVVAPFYDNLLAKVAVWGADREQARLAMLQALDELRVTGVPTTAPAARAILEHPDFVAVRHSTRWLTDHGADLLAAPIADVTTILSRTRIGPHPSPTSHRARSRCSGGTTASPASPTTGPTPTPVPASRRPAATAGRRGTPPARRGRARPATAACWPRCRAPSDRSTSRSATRSRRTPASPCWRR